MTNFNEIIKLCRVEEENQVIKKPKWKKPSKVKPKYVVDFTV